MRQKADKSSSPSQLYKLATKAHINDNILREVVPALSGASLAPPARDVQSHGQSSEQNEAFGRDQAGTAQLSPQMQLCRVAAISQPGQIDGAPVIHAAPLCDYVNPSSRSSFEGGTGRQQNSPISEGEAANPAAEDKQVVVVLSESSSQIESGSQPESGTSTEETSTVSGTTESAAGQHPLDTTPLEPCEEAESPSNNPTAQGIGAQPAQASETHQKQFPSSPTASIHRVAQQGEPVCMSPSSKQSSEHSPAPLVSSRGMRDMRAKGSLQKHSNSKARSKDDDMPSQAQILPAENGMSWAGGLAGHPE